MNNSSISFKSLEMENFSLNLKKKKCLNNINLKINKKEKIAIIGPSGSGKTLLLESLILANNPSSGTIKINSREMWKLKNIINYRKFFSFCPQVVPLPENQIVLNAVQAAYINNWSTIKTFLSLFIHFKKKEIINVLKEIKLEDKLYHKISVLSGGEKQCISLSRLFVSKSQVLVADEPFNGLDPKKIKLILNLMKINYLKYSKVLICSLHQPEIAKKFFDRIIGIKRGKLVFDIKSSFLTNKKIADLYN